MPIPQHIENNVSGNMGKLQQKCQQWRFYTTINSIYRYFNINSTKFIDPQTSGIRYAEHTIIAYIYFFIMRGKPQFMKLQIEIFWQRRHVGYLKPCHTTVQYWCSQLTLPYVHNNEYSESVWVLTNLMQHWLLTLPVHHYAHECITTYIM